MQIRQTLQPESQQLDHSRKHHGVYLDLSLWSRSKQSVGENFHDYLSGILEIISIAYDQKKKKSKDTL